MFIQGQENLLSITANFLLLDKMLLNGVNLNFVFSLLLKYYFIEINCFNKCF